MAEQITLKTAIESHDRDDGIFSSYETYRKEAKDYGYILIEGTQIPTKKEKGTWILNKADLDRAITSFKNKKAESEKHMQLMMADYQKRVFHPGTIWISDTKYYNNRGDFRLEVDTYAQARKDSNGTWYCNTCNLPAETEHNNPECHRCSDWSPCGTDCTLSRVYCSRCGKELVIP
jgi:hypothetical protein